MVSLVHQLRLHLRLRLRLRLHLHLHLRLRLRLLHLHSHAVHEFPWRTVSTSNHRVILPCVKRRLLLVSRPDFRLPWCSCGGQG